MKVTIEVDCTPDEARSFMGLPDVKPMQAAVMASLEQQAVRATESFAPDSMLKLWFTTVPQMSGQMQDMFTRIMTSAAGGATGGGRS
ncbi:DUF6489 family protein [Acidisphaera sp. L21]|uniref:DUF6489 family protein n=1 Tax=Acidisphaera sp. L21 TaxID=1641851 RepID=UPI00131BF27E|nr:DUF6489 family protein [Acidisphaera sp. L21]